jgi:hypothetical protein
MAAGCGSSGPTGSSSGDTSGTAAPAASASGASPTSSPTDGQTDTDWGRIWDWVPIGFPTYAGATSSEETDLGPASVVDVVEGAQAADVIAWYQAQLQGAGYATDALNGPMEDGSYTLDMHGQPAGCQLQVATARMGTGDILGITVRYGAACPNS